MESKATQVVDKDTDFTMNFSIYVDGNSCSQVTNTASGVSQGFLLWLIINNFVFGTIIVLGNASLFLVINRDPCRCLQSPSVILIANLSVADFFMGVVSYQRAVELIYMYYGWPDPIILNVAQYFVGAVSIFVAVATLMSMAYERYIAITKPFHYRQRITNKRAKTSITVIWVNAIVMSLLPLSDVKRENFLLAYCYSHFFIPSVVLLAVYFKIFKEVARQKRELKEVRVGLTAENRRRQLERESRMVRMFVMILSIFYLSFLPFFIRVHLLYFCPCKTSYGYSVFHFVTNEFLLISSVLDPFLYAWRLPKFKRSFRACFQRRIGQSSVVRWIAPTSPAN